MPGSRDKENSILSVAASSDFREVTFKCLVFTRQAIFTFFAFPQVFFSFFARPSPSGNRNCSQSVIGDRDFHGGGGTVPQEKAYCEM